MRYCISIEPKHLRAQLLGKETVEEMLEFFDAVAQESEAHECRAILLDIRSSRAIFHIGARRLFEYFTTRAGGRPSRIALLGDTSELQLSHDYLALLARQLHLNVESFRDEAAAVGWLTGDGDVRDRRRHAERRQRPQPHFPEQRLHSERRGDRSAQAAASP